MSEEQIKEIKEVMDIYLGDKSEERPYSVGELTDFLTEIHIILKNEKCWNCGKLLIFNDYDNWECSDCGVQLKSKTVEREGKQDE